MRPEKQCSGIEETPRAKPRDEQLTHPNRSIAYPYVRRDLASPPTRMQHPAAKRHKSACRYHHALESGRPVRTANLRLQSILATAAKHSIRTISGSTRWNKKNLPCAANDQNTKPTGTSNSLTKHQASLHPSGTANRASKNVVQIGNSPKPTRSMSGPRLASPRLVRSCLQVSCGWLGPEKLTAYYMRKWCSVQRAGARYGTRARACQIALRCRWWRCRALLSSLGSLD